MLDDPDTQKSKSLQPLLQALQRGEYTRVVSLCEEYLAAHPHSVAHLHLLARALIKQHKPAAARAHIEHALSVTPDRAPLYEELGTALALGHDYQAALVSFRRAVQLDADLSTAHRKLAQVLLELGRGAESDRVLTAWLRRDRDTALIAGSVEHARAGRVEQAETDLRKALRHNPYNVDAMRLLAALYRRQGKRSDAEALLRRAVDRAPDFTQALADLGELLLDSGQWPDAAAIYRQLTRLRPRDADAWAGLGRALGFAGNESAAIRALEQALRLNGDSPEVHLTYGHMLKTLGRQDDALAAYRRSIACCPALGESWWSMANTKVFKFDRDDIAAMQRQLALPALRDSARVHFHFALGKAWEDLQDFDRAWHHYRSGNEAKRLLVDYDPVRNDLYLQRIQQAFTAELFAANGAAARNCDAIFIVGLPRSGSTLIEQILASHSQVEATAELPYMGAVATGSARHRRDGLTYPDTVVALTPRDFAAYGQEYLQQVRRHRRRGARLFIDKMPNNFIHIGFIRLLFPKARVIHTRRHPVENCLAAYRQLFAEGQDFTYDMLELAEFYRGYSRLMDHWHRLLPGFVLDVHYEETIAHLETQVRRLLHFCGLEFEPSCLHFYRTQRAVRSASAQQVRQPLYDHALARRHRYRRHLAIWEEELAEIVMP